MWITTTELCASNDEQVTSEALNFQVICSPVSATINLDNHPHLNGIQLADKSNVSDPIDVLIGYNNNNNNNNC
jgi:hypothetical protein